MEITLGPKSFVEQKHFVNILKCEIMLGINQWSNNKYQGFEYKIELLIRFGYKDILQELADNYAKELGASWVPIIESGLVELSPETLKHINIYYSKDGNE